MNTNLIPAQPFYRTDIDVLRAISITFVVLFHFFPLYFPGGFVGVDVFFVISGFLMTEIIHTDLKSNSFSFLHFYCRRIVRLFPSLIVVFCFTLVVGLFVLLSDELLTTAKALLGGVFFFSNIQLYLDAGYFDTASDLKVFLHLWSLSVEEQFYLIWPLIIFFGYRRNRIARFIIAFLFISFCCNILYSYWDESLAFYMLLTRMWQLVSGGAVFWMLQNQKSRNHPKSLLRVFIGIIGVVLIFTALFVIDKTYTYPGFISLLPTLGAMLLIAFPLIDIPIGKWFFSNSFLVKIGKISYPLYLWHWCLLALSKLTGIWKNDFLFQILLILISITFSFLTYRFIEVPIRNVSDKIKMAKKLTAAMLVICVIAFSIVIQNGIPSRYPEFESNNEENWEWDFKNDPISKQYCDKNFPEFELCAIANPNSPPNVFVIGDSHANHLFPGLSAHYTKQGKNTLLLARSGVVPFIDIYSTNRKLNNLNDAFMVLHNNRHSIDTVILSSIWVSYADEVGVLLSDGYYKNGITDVQNSSMRSQKDIFIAGLDRTLQFLKSYSVNTLIFEGLPTLVDHPQFCKRRPHIANPRDCRFSKSFIDHQQQVPNQIFLDFRSRYSFITLSLNAIICDGKIKDNECGVFFDDHLIYQDNHHLTIFGSKYVVDKAFRISGKK